MCLPDIEKIRSYKLHIFDLDDTLINTSQNYKMAQEKAIRLVLKKWMREENSSQIHWLCRQFGSGQPELFFSAFVKLYVLKSIPDSKSTHNLAEEITIKLVEIYNRIYWKNLIAFDGAISWLKTLSELGRVLYLASNGKYRQQIKKLNATNLMPFFQKNQVLVSSQFETHKKKPSPFMLERILLLANMNKRDALFYGNIESDILAGKLAGISTAFHKIGPDPQLKADFRFKSWSLFSNQNDPESRGISLD